MSDGRQDVGPDRRLATETPSANPHRVLVTGGGGLVGRETVAGLVRRGYQVRVLDSVGFDRAPAEVESQVGDCTDPAVVAAAMDGVHAVIHLAAIPNPRRHPARTVFVNNVAATFVVVDEAGKAGVRRAVIASSISALGLVYAGSPASPAYVPIDEDHPDVAEDPYALSKLVDEFTARTLARRYGLSILVYRFPYVDTAAALARRATVFESDPGAGAAELWAYLDVRDAAHALVLGVEATTTGVHVLNVVAEDTLSATPTMDLVHRFHPTTEVREIVAGRHTAFADERMRTLLDFAPRYRVLRPEAPVR